jgi:hypothetical protein
LLLDAHRHTNLPGLHITSRAANQDFGANFAFHRCEADIDPPHRRWR